MRQITGVDELWMCQCMQSKHWPECDGSHHTFTNFGPEPIELDPGKTYDLCTCYKTKNRPFCDGSHND